MDLDKVGRFLGHSVYIAYHWLDKMLSKA